MVFRELAVEMLAQTSGLRVVPDQRLRPGRREQRAGHERRVAMDLMKTSEAGGSRLVTADRHRRRGRRRRDVYEVSARRRRAVVADGEPLLSRVDRMATRVWPTLFGYQFVYELVRD